MNPAIIGAALVGICGFTFVNALVEVTHYLGTFIK